MLDKCTCYYSMYMLIPFCREVNPKDEDEMADNIPTPPMVACETTTTRL